ncbi:uncharacterized protein BT62DRAFT_995372 [Guyanagaster necrorhizus]|uniref:Uncharacterized protein n=1 Tax=Guyanagaster necrorhizus TaxID=856835 RepID=A0A9P7VQY0_9AGAR|nr:uncharacterized protein BT62DRAFT_995372 [Guyanagaster necrorhizus MCA 3950]KAG7444344.1 hypothetical protein BT62DRAFT_995372 [Guyanagaster necrorhizus MCA 3950]
MSDESRVSLRNKLLANLLADAAINDGVLAEALTMEDILSRTSDHSDALKGGLTISDITTFAPNQSFQISPSIKRRLTEELDATLQAISDFLEVEDSPPDSLTQRLRENSEKNGAIREEADNSHRRIEKIMGEIREMHPLLQEELVQSLRKWPPVLNSQRQAHHDFLATTIETFLIKLSLIRARCHQLLYGFKDDGNDMASALMTMHNKLTEEESELEKEEAELDRQLHEYHRLLHLVDGNKSGFRQVLEDWSQIQKETEECRRDLRRMGWTGD